MIQFAYCRLVFDIYATLYHYHNLFLPQLYFPWRFVVFSRIDSEQGLETRRCHDPEFQQAVATTHTVPWQKKWYTRPKFNIAPET